MAGLVIVIIIVLLLLIDIVVFDLLALFPLTLFSFFPSCVCSPLHSSFTSCSASIRRDDMMTLAPSSARRMARAFPRP